MTTIELGDKVTIHIPQNWGELNDKQAAYIMELFHSKMGKLNRNHFLVLVFRRIINYKESFWLSIKNPKAIEQVNADIYLLATTTLDWLITEDNKLNFDSIFVPFNNSVKPLLQQVTFGKFMTLLAGFKNLSKQKDIDEFVAQLTATKLKPWQKYFTILQFMNNLKYIQTTDVDIFGQPVSLDELFNAPKNEDADESENSLGWLPIRCYLIENNFATVKEIDEIPIWEVFTYMLVKSDEYKKYEKNRKSNN